MKTQTWNYWIVSMVLGTSFALAATGCGTSNPSGTTGEDSSTSGTVASMIGGANSSAQGGGNLGFYNEPALKRPFQWADLLSSPLSNAWARDLCPTVGGSASGCTAGTNGGVPAGASGIADVTMAYSSCNFKGSGATWTGSQIITGTGISCSSFGSPTTIYRTFGSGSSRTAASGTSVQVDTLGGLVMTRNGSTGVSADGTASHGRRGDHPERRRSDGDQRFRHQLHRHQCLWHRDVQPHALHRLPALVHQYRWNARGHRLGHLGAQPAQDHRHGRSQQRDLHPRLLPTHRRLDHDHVCRDQRHSERRSAGLHQHEGVARVQLDLRSSDVHRARKRIGSRDPRSLPVIAESKSWED